MQKPSSSSRRSFLKKAAATALITGATPSLLARPGRIVELPVQPYTSRISSNDQINIGVIGMGIMGFNNAATSTQVPGVKLAAVCDLYAGRLQHAKEVYGADLFTTRNYKEILDRKDIDAVIIATSDHWHDRMAIEAMNKGKHVYLEKPMVHRLDEGAAVIQTQAKTEKVLQVGSQRVSSVVTKKTQELFESGVIGKLVLVETWMDRHSANGAWQYSIPTDAKTPGAVDWENFLGDAPKVAYDPVRFFRWRNYQDYGTGVAGDLFVHLFSALHAITSSKGPERIFASGGLRYWKDGRDVPDIIAGIYDYPESQQHPAFNLQMRVNFADGSESGEGLRLIGTDGVIIMGWGAVKVIRHKISDVPSYGGWDSFNTFSQAQQREYEKWYKATYPTIQPATAEPDIEFKAPEGYSANMDHHLNFYNGIRDGKRIVEDAWFGMRAGGPALAANKSYFEKKIVKWNPETATVIS
ncbi:MAG TPA: Gfo/Idh/MocA family oxidoreductase [Ohtaekwangia sp.]|nr:Gfo/Idh/MocA family oxidoreductase [Ohtaekwangia sp.]